ncbi:MAG: aspartate 1-decarboxylase [Sedimentisphaerales bacterium]|nr:aspartate 1-decarboxylase [Sedimentisphaerales bacterium]
MLIKILKSKLHRARVTETRLNYPGSILIDETLMKKSGILPYEGVLVADLNNGSRVETYAVPAPADSGQIIVLGAAAKRMKKNDIVIIFSFAYCTPAEARKLKTKVTILDEKNKIVKAVCH